LREVVVVNEVSDGDTSFESGVEALREIILDELNVKDLNFGEAEDIVSYDLKPNLGVVGPKYGRLVPGLRAALAEAPPEVGARAAAGESVSVSVDGEEIELSPDELLVEPTERHGYALEREGGLSVALRTEIDHELVDEGLVRELVHKVQNLRREKGFEIEESVAVGLAGSPRIQTLLGERWGDYFKAEVLARDLDLDAGAPDGAPDGGFESVKVDGETLGVRVEPLGEAG
jgi:isoleucyl-tRNA synthetase